MYIVSKNPPRHLPDVTLQSLVLGAQTSQAQPSFLALGSSNWSLPLRKALRRKHLSQDPQREVLISSPLWLSRPEGVSEPRFNSTGMEPHCSAQRKGKQQKRSSCPSAFTVCTSLHLEITSCFKLRSAAFPAKIQPFALG